MADLTGIDNVGEFFSAHYLQDRLVDDVREVAPELSALTETLAQKVRSEGQALFRALSDLPSLSVSAKKRTAHDLCVRWFEALGYTRDANAYAALPATSSTDNRQHAALPLLFHVPAVLAVVQAGWSDEQSPLLAERVANVAELPDVAVQAGLTLPRSLSIEDAVSSMFAAEQPVRFVLVMGATELVLAERARWGRGQYLRFDLPTLLRRRDAQALRVLAALLGHALLTGAGAPVPETLLGRSHAHAVRVSADLKFAAREAVELLGNEWVHYMRTTRKKAMHGEAVARELTEECLVYLFRLLFLFYAEAKAKELHGLPMQSEEYARGYSLEVLRELEQVPLATPHAREGYFFHESLTRLFRLVNEGYSPVQGTLGLGAPLQGSAEGRTSVISSGFTMAGLHSTLFSLASTPRLSSVRFRNECLQRVLRLLSLSPEGRSAGGRAWGRGRISYAQLGISELGAVYEGLLSYSGFFAREALAEVHKAGADEADLTQATHFVRVADLHQYTAEERLFLTGERDEAGRPVRSERRHDPGTFIFRLAGRDRERSASYYTPEVLTRCLVKYALKELLPGKSAADILRLTVCEPAMGSGAFLVEAIDQLADAYLERRQHEVGRRIAAADYASEKQRVKARIAESNVYGVDLNPMAPKLAAVSLWLASMFADQPSPSFSARLYHGNSLVGARLAVYTPEDFQSDDKLAKALLLLLKQKEAHELEDALEAALAPFAGLYARGLEEVRSAVQDVRLGSADEAGEDDDAPDAEGDDAADVETSGAASMARGEALKKALKKLTAQLKVPRWQRSAPRPLSFEEAVSARPRGSVYHFLLPHPDMCGYDEDKALKELAPDALARVKAWRKSVLAELLASEMRRLEQLSLRIDDLLRRVADDRAQMLADTASRVAVWEDPEGPRSPYARTGAERETLVQMARAPGHAYHTLRQAADLWACLWSWPAAEALHLPTRDTWLSALESLLLGEPQPVLPAAQMRLPSWRPLDLGAEDVATDEEGSGDAPDTAARNALATPRAAQATAHGLWDVVARVHRDVRPMFWELEAPEVFLRGGFDLMVGNPPWLKLQWNEQGLLEEFEPRLALDGVSASDVAKRRREILSTPERVREYVAEAGATQGAQAYLNAPANYPLLAGVQTNLYKNFLVRAWELSVGVTALIHQDGLFDDPKGGALREEAYARLRYVFRFKNELQLFADVDHQRTYMLSVAAESRPPEFVAMANLFDPSTIDGSLAHDGAGLVPAIKSDQEGVGFETKPHASRAVRIDSAALGLFATLFDKAGTPASRARLPLIHSAEALAVLRKLAAHTARLRDLGDEVFGAEMWHETNAQKDGTIQRETRTCSRPADWVLSGPHFYVGTPFNKSPRQPCRHNTDYDVIDLEGIPDDFLPRTNYVPACDPETYRARTPKFKGKPVTDYYRHVHREMLALTGERTLVPALMPAGIGHVNSVTAILCASVRKLVAFSALSSTLPVDFFVRARGAGHLQPAQSSVLPIPKPGSPFAPLLAARALRLNCLTSHYADLWNEVWPTLPPQAWSLADARLSAWPKPKSLWSRVSPVRNAFERRMALVELDALAALELGLTAEELCTIYRTQFPVLREYEQETYFDAHGRIAFTSSKGLVGVGLDRKSFELWQACLRDGRALPRDFPASELTPPFTLCDREVDMTRAYEAFAALRARE